ncbi:MAG: hypothetical protein IPG45_23795 [Deltaproteobacteria bacterium]|nr:hypothetical protein [Deltaproteobacteria bacterium]
MSGLATCGLVGCQATIALPAAPLEATESALLLLEAGGRPRAYAFDALHPADSLSFAPQVNLRLGVYAVPLAELGIAPGEINLEDTTAPIAPTPISERTLSDPYDRWSAPQAASPIWGELKVPRITDGCLDLERVVPMRQPLLDSGAQGRCWTTGPELDGTIFGNPLGVWEADREGVRRIFGGAITSSTGPTATATSPLLAGHVGLDDQLYLLQKGGQLWRGKAGRSYQSLGFVPGSSTASTAWMVGSRSIGRVQLYILDADGGLWRWEESSGFTTILTPGGGRPFDQNGGLVWLGEDDVLALGPMNGEVLRVQDLEVTVTELPGTTTPTALYATYRSGVLLGDLGGQIYRFREGLWVPIVGAPRARDIYVILELADGLLYGPASGQLRFFSEARPECTGELRLERTPFGGISYERSAVIFSSSGIFGDGGQISITRLTLP